MKRLLKFLWRDKVDLIMLIAAIAATVQIWIVGKDLTIGFAVITLYVFGVILRIGFITEEMQKQDKHILKLNLQIQEKDKFIIELIKKYGNPKEGVEFLNKLKTKLNPDK